MNKGELIAKMSANSGKSKADCEMFLNLVTDSIVSTLGTGEAVNLVGFGSFHVKQRDARMGRNPKTGQPMNISAYKQPIFRAGKKMKDSCN